VSAKNGGRPPRTRTGGDVALLAAPWPLLPDGEYAGTAIKVETGFAPWAEFRTAASAASSIEATLARCRRLAGVEPPQAFARSVALAVREVRAVAAEYRSEAVAQWELTTLEELGGLLFRHVASRVELDIAVSERAVRVARRNGDI